MDRRAFGAGLVGGALVMGAGRLGSAAAPKRKMLVITYAQGFKHSSRPVAAATVQKLGVETGEWEVVEVVDTMEATNAALAADKLKDLHLVFFANTTGDLGWTPPVKAGFYEWIRKGGAYAGVHSAGDTYHGDAEYLDLVRGEFLTHGPQMKVAITNQDPKHPACKDVPAVWEIYDEIYEYKNWDRKRCHVLLTMHKHPQKDEQGDFPVAWTNRVGKGRMFYTSLGHREDVYENKTYLAHLTGGLQWALGLKKGDDTPGNPFV